jgi:spore coat polysaccharide biosynthesis protein SpsF
MNDQEQLWAGEFGTGYIARNKGPYLAAAALGFMARALSKAPGVRSILELGANIGINLDGLQHLYPEAQQTAVEINADACRVLRQNKRRDVHHCAIADFNPQGRQWDLVVVKGVLIHIAPENLPPVYDMIDACARRYALIAEYYNPTPVSVRYRDQEHALWKRDFAGEIIDGHDGWECADYGFVWERDPMPQDNISWFLLERR